LRLSSTITRLFSKKPAAARQTANPISAALVLISPTRGWDQCSKGSAASTLALEWEKTLAVEGPVRGLVTAAQGIAKAYLVSPSKAKAPSQPPWLGFPVIKVRTAVGTSCTPPTAKKAAAVAPAAMTHPPPPPPS